MKKSKSHAALPLPVTLALRRLGADVAKARKLRGIPMKLMAERAMISRNTLTRVEKGDAGVALGTFASVLFVLGQANRLAELLADDTVSQQMIDDRMPKRVRSRGGRGYARA